MRPTEQPALVAHAAILVVILSVTIAAFFPTLRNGFVNWDDPDIFISNQALARPRVVAWAFSTSLMGHYQPLAWIVWSAATRLFGSEARTYHALGLAGHLVNAVLIYALALQIGMLRGLNAAVRRRAALAAALLFAVHPLSVEPVAWASALPYVLALAFLLISTIAYIRAVSSPRRGPWLLASLAAFAASILSRPVAATFPFALAALNILALRRVKETRRALAELLPFLAIAVAGVIAETASRDVATLGEIGVGARLTLAVSAPFRYLARTIVPIRLSPLDLLPIDPGVSWLALGASGAALVLVSYAAVAMRSRVPWLAAAWVSYLVLLAPAVGLAPTGLQATADRYMYVPAVVFALAAGALIVKVALRHGQLAWVACMVVLLVPLAAATWRQVSWWRDSITLWTRAVDLDRSNDVALYNLAVALAEAGREEEAMTRYRETLRLVPDHDLARRNLAHLEATKFQRDADALAASGRPAEAIPQYERALALDPSRANARASRGMALVQVGRFADAIPDLERAVREGVDDPALPNALAFALAEEGRGREAADLLRAALARRPGDVGLMQNLARLLATYPDPAVRDGAEALRLAISATDSTQGRDARVLDTLAAAYAETGQLELARQTWQRAEAVARELGEPEMAAQIRARARRYANPRK